MFDSDWIRGQLAQIRPYNSQWRQYRLLEDVRDRVGLEGIGLLDISLDKILSSTERETSKQELQQLIISEWLKQIADGGTTIGFDFDKMMKHGKIMRHADTILELRQKEMQRVIVYTGGPINLKALWLTAYGYKVLDALGLGTKCSHHELTRVEQALDDIGVTIRATDGRIDVACTWGTHLHKNDYPVKMSQGLANYIWRRADNYWL